MVARAVKDGASMSDCVSLVEKASQKIKVYFAVDTLTYLHKGGRIGGASQFLGTALNLKPILELKEGKIEGIEKIRTSKKAHARLLELMEKNIENKNKLSFIGIIAANAPEASNYLLTECKKRFQAEEIMIGVLSPVIGAHTGPGTVGVGFLESFD